MAINRIRILCVDDHRLVRDGISLIIRRGGRDMEVVGAASTGEEALDLFKRLRPDVTLMDLQLGAMNGLEAIRAIRRGNPSARIIVLTMSKGDEDVFRALEAGAAAYVLKDTLADTLVRIVREVHSGKHPMSTEVEACLAARAGQAALSLRETEVMGFVSKGLRNKEIAAALGISEETVQIHMKRILAKLKVQGPHGGNHRRDTARDHPPI